MGSASARLRRVELKMKTPPVAVVAEQNPALGETIADSLEVMGFEPVVVRNEHAAAEALDATDVPKLLVVDANFGQVPRPYAYVRTTLAKAPFLPVVIANTPDNPIPPDLAKRVAFAEKPFGKQELADGVEAAQTMASAVEPER
jgi:hypothetical protein